jgi:hypothetical protein
MLQGQAGTEAHLGERNYRYERHRPEQTLLYQPVEAYYPAFGRRSADFQNVVVRRSCH